MLSSRNTGKYLSNNWHKERNNAMKDAYVSGDYSQEELELTDHQISGVYSDETYEAETTPIEPDTPSRVYDIRDDPKKGD